MNLQEIIIKSKREKESLHEPDEDSDIVLTQFSNDDPIEEHLKELCEDLVGLTSPGQVRAVLSLYLPEIDWGGQEA